MFKRILLISGLFLLLVVAALLAAVILIDPNDYKDKIQDIARKQTGRELEIVDDMKLSVFPWIGVEFGAVRFGNAEGFGPEPFARISGARVKVRLLPLFSRRIEVDTITLLGLEVRLAIAADGRSNWEDLSATTADPAAKPQPSPPAGTPADAAFALPAMLTITGLDIRDAAVYWRDNAGGTALDVTGFNLKSGKIEPDQPVELELDFGFRSGEPVLDGNISLAMRVTAHYADEFFRIENLRMKSQLNSDMLPVRPMTAEFESNIAIDLKRETIEAPAFTVSALGLRATGGLRGQEILDEPHLAGTIDVAGFKPRAFLQALGVDPPETADPATLSRGSLALAFDTGPDHVNARDIRLGLDDSMLRGNASVRNFVAPGVVFDIELDQIDIDRYLPPGEETPVVTPATAPAAALELPMDTLRGLDLDGKLAIGKLGISGLTLTDIQLQSRAINGLISVTPIRAELYGGHYAGNIRLDARGDVPSFSIDEAVTGVQSEPLLKDMLDLDLVSGVADFRIRVIARGTSDAELRRSANGNGNFSFRNGAIKGFNTAQMIREATALLQGNTPPAHVASETDFTELTGTLQIGNGLVRNDDLRASSPYLRLAGSGQVDIVNERIDYRLNARIVDTSTGQGGAGLDNVKGIDVPLRITGALRAPDIRVDADFLRNLLKEKLAPKVEQMRKELEQKADTQKQELKKELQDKVDQQLKRLLR